MASRNEKFNQLSYEASICIRCSRMATCRAVLSPANGSLYASIVFVAEAPGRFGAARTGVPFQGDRSGENFETLLANTSLTRKDVFITNAVLCNPLNNGNNHRPTATEINNCGPFLRTTLEIIKPQVVVSLGGVALKAVNRLLGTQYRLTDHATCPQQQKNFTLLPLYHPSPRVIYTRRSLDQQKCDFKKIPGCLKSNSNQ